MMIAAKALLLVVSLVTTVILARALGPDGRGVVAVALGLSLILKQVGTLGVTTANPYFLARDAAAVERVRANCLWLAASLGIGLALIGVALRAVLPAVVSGVAWEPFLIALAGIPFGLAALFLQSILLGLGRTVAYNVVEVGQEVVVAVAMAIILLSLDGGPTAAVLVLSGGFVASTFAYLAILRGAGGRRFMPDVGLGRTMVAYSFRVYVALLLAFLVIRVDLLLVNSYRGSGEAGIYSVDAAIAAGMYLLPSVIALNLFVRVARGHATEVTAKVFRIVALGYGAVCLLAVPLAGPFIDLLYGPRFSEATTLFYWLVPGIFSLGMLTILAHHFAGRGFPVQAMLVWVVGLTVNVAINVAFLPSHGTWVAAMSSSVAYGLLLLLHMRLFARDIGGYGAMVPRLGEALALLRLTVRRFLVRANGRRAFAPSR
jgi:O-antigen/teichoic acid export membrane protein